MKGDCGTASAVDHNQTVCGSVVNNKWVQLKLGGLRAVNRVMHVRLQSRSPMRTNAGRDNRSRNTVEVWCRNCSAYDKACQGLTALYNGT